MAATARPSSLILVFVGDPEDHHRGADGHDDAKSDADLGGIAFEEGEDAAGHERGREQERHDHEEPILEAAFAFLVRQRRRSLFRLFVATLGQRVAVSGIVGPFAWVGYTASIQDTGVAHGMPELEACVPISISPQVGEQPQFLDECGLCTGRTRDQSRKIESFPCTSRVIHPKFVPQIFAGSVPKMV